MKAAEPVHDRPRLRWLRRRLREAVRDNVWLLPALGAVTGFGLAMTIGKGGDRRTIRGRSASIAPGTRCSPPSG